MSANLALAMPAIAVGALALMAGGVALLVNKLYPRVKQQPVPEATKVMAGTMFDLGKAPETYVLQKLRLQSTAAFRGKFPGAVWSVNKPTPAKNRPTAKTGR
jgi:hypothetical protein